MSSHHQPLPAGLSPDCIDVPSELAIILARVRYVPSADPSDAGNTIKLRDLTAATDPLKHKLQNARAALHTLPDITRTIPEQEAEIGRVQAKIERQRAALQELKQFGLKFAAENAKADGDVHLGGATTDGEDDCGIVVLRVHGEVSKRPVQTTKQTEFHRAAVIHGVAQSPTTNADAAGSPMHLTRDFKGMVGKNDMRTEQQLRSERIKNQDSVEDTRTIDNAARDKPRSRKRLLEDALERSSPKHQHIATAFLGLRRKSAVFGEEKGEFAAQLESQPAFDQDRDGAEPVRSTPASLPLTAWGRQTVADLRKELRKRNLVSRGAKAVLVQRLTDYEAAQNQAKAESNAAEDAAADKAKPAPVKIGEDMILRPQLSEMDAMSIRTFPYELHVAQGRSPVQARAGNNYSSMGPSDPIDMQDDTYEEVVLLTDPDKDLLDPAAGPSQADDLSDISLESVEAPPLQLRCDEGSPPRQRGSGTVWKTFRFPSPPALALDVDTSLESLEAPPPHPGSQDGSSPPRFTGSGTSWTAPTRFLL